MQASRFVANAAALTPVCEQLEEDFAGTQLDSALELDPRGTPFQLHVWRLVVAIPYGTTVSYSGLAQRLEHPRAVRAVSAAVAVNPLPIVIPCHRVVGRDGKLTGSAGGLHCKAWLSRTRAHARLSGSHQPRSKRWKARCTRRARRWRSTRSGFRKNQTKTSPATNPPMCAQ